MYWKLTLDPPHTYAQEQGDICSRYAQDFHDSPSGMLGTFRCPTTGLVMLEPSFRKRDFGSDFRPLASWRQTTSEVARWRALAKSMDSLAMFTNLRPAGQPTFFDPLTTAAGIFVYNANNAFYDNLDWALESLFTLGIDEAFAIHYRGLTDELLRKNNWLYIQWDTIGIHISHAGHVRVCRYQDRGHPEETPEVVHEFDISEAGDLLGKSGEFVFIPIPRHGLAMYHLTSALAFGATATNARNFTKKGAHLIPWDFRTIGNFTRLFDSSVVRLAMNPFHANDIGFQSITFAASGSYLDTVFSPHYRPSVSPVGKALYLDNFGGRFGTVTPTLRNQNNSADWAAGTDRQGRVRFDMTTSDARYTPFVYGWGVQWNSVPQVRAPGKVEITTNFDPTKPGFTTDVLQRLEFTDDSEGAFEGSARLKIQSVEAATKVERGDGLFQIEKSENGTTWSVVNGGIIKYGRPQMQYHPDWGFFWVVDASLHGQEERFEEMANCLGTAFDGLTIGEGINLVLSTTGFSSIPEDKMPAALLNLRVPKVKEGTNFRFHPRLGDKLKHVLRVLLLLARTQNQEYKMVYDWPNEVWTVLRRPHGEVPTETWTLTYKNDAENFASRIAYYDEPLELEFQPIEATVFTVLGIAESGDKEQAKVYESSPIDNYRAISDPGTAEAPNWDYTGRVKAVRILAVGVESVEVANEIARKVNPRFFHRNVLATVMLPQGHFTLDTPPDTKVTLKLPPYVGKVADRTFTLWVKKRTVVIEGDDHGPVEGIANERLILQCDEIWENPIKGE